MNPMYDDFAKTFSNSRKNMRWPEIAYIVSCIDRDQSILDVGCGNGRFLMQYHEYFWSYPVEYVWIDNSTEIIEEAIQQFPKTSFMTCDMQVLWEALQEQEFENIVCIASIHHLTKLSQREHVFHDMFSLLKPDGKVYMTNWALESSLNKEVYGSYKLQNSQNTFWSNDFEIPIGKHKRYYHSFSVDELKYLAKNTGFRIIENTIFDGNKNILTILHKPWNSPMMNI